MTEQDALEPVYLEPQKQNLFEKLRERGISQRVLEAMHQIPREIFIPEKERQHTYEMDSIPLKAKTESSVSAPHVVADMLDMLDVSPTDRVLEIGAGTGYQASVLSLIAGEVTTVELDPGLAVVAQSNFTELGLDNIELMIGDGTALSEITEQRFDKIIVTAAIYPILQNGIFNLLKEGGICVVPIAPEYGFKNVCRLTKLQKQDGEMKIMETNSDNYYYFVALGGEWGYDSISNSIATRNFMELFGENQTDYLKQREKFIRSERETTTIKTKNWVSDVEEE